MTQTDPALVAAWDRLHRVLPDGWQMGKPSYHDAERVWVLYAFDAHERPKVGKRAREASARGRTPAECVDEMSRLLWEFHGGRDPK